MILGIGIDTVDVDRMQKWLTVKGLPERFFHLYELQVAYENTKTTALTLAARFAAKEAFGKALGTGLSNIKLRDICVKNDTLGKPQLYITGTAKVAAEKMSVDALHISLTHEKKIAVAVVLLEKFV
ncbi:MAG: 4'-phosphopantetheinyl transferase [Treponema sp.]|nr:MAG: 4'-phosphopantetheinyl transferase [Treponema sp.]